MEQAAFKCLAIWFPGQVADRRHSPQTVLEETAVGFLKSAETILLKVWDQESADRSHRKLSLRGVQSGELSPI
jgi:hypothetical protein